MLEDWDVARIMTPSAAAHALRNIDQELEVQREHCHRYHDAVPFASKWKVVHNVVGRCLVPRFKRDDTEEVWKIVRALDSGLRDLCESDVNHGTRCGPTVTLLLESGGGIGYTSLPTLRRLMISQIVAVFRRHAREDPTHAAGLAYLRAMQGRHQKFFQDSQRLANAVLVETLKLAGNALKKAKNAAVDRIIELFGESPRPCLAFHGQGLAHPHALPACSARQGLAHPHALPAGGRVIVQSEAADNIAFMRGHSLIAAGVGLESCPLFVGRVIALTKGRHKGIANSVNWLSMLG
jgi:hypothetical protein